jgi:hypothetical protein
VGPESEMTTDVAFCGRQWLAPNEADYVRYFTSGEPEGRWG